VDKFDRENASTGTGKHTAITVSYRPTNP